MAHAEFQLSFPKMEALGVPVWETIEKIITYNQASTSLG